MAENNIDGKKVAILVANDFEQVEMVEPRKALQQAGAMTVLVSPEKHMVQGLNHIEKADMFPVDMELEQAKASDFDALLLPGGALNPDQLRVNEQARQFVSDFDESGKPIAAICHAPWTLISAGLVRGRTLTSWPSIRDDVKNAGGNWVDQESVVDDNWVTSRGPQDIPAFNKNMIELFSQGRKPAKKVSAQSI